MKQFKGRPVVPGKALCLPMTIGSTTGGMVLYTAACMGRQPASPLTVWPRPVQFWQASGARTPCPWWIAWARSFLQAVKTGDPITVTVG